MYKLQMTIATKLNETHADFGFAKIANGFSLSTMCGSPGYVAPEILTKKKYGTPVDMWAMGE
jgi:calcium/calmodulin-dependent protein kinase I